MLIYCLILKLFFSLLLHDDLCKFKQNILTDSNSLTYVNMNICQFLWMWITRAIIANIFNTAYKLIKISKAFQAQCNSLQLIFKKSSLFTEVDLMQGKETKFVEKISLTKASVLDSDNCLLGLSVIGKEA